jgi:hypothetical protein
MDAFDIAKLFACGPWSTDFGASLSLEPELPKQGVRRSSKELIPHPEILEATTMQYS